MQLIVNGESLDLPQGFSMSIEDSSPVFNDRGSQSLPATVPANRRNVRLLHYPHRIDSGIDPRNPLQEVSVVSGAYRRGGVLNMSEGGKKEGITFNVGFDNSTAYAKWSSLKLSELENLPTLLPTDEQAPISSLTTYLERIYHHQDKPSADDFAVFPIAVAKETTGSDEKSKQTWWEMLNVPGTRGLEMPGNVKRIIDGTVTDVSVPEGYGLSPFLKAWRVVELVFAGIGLEVKSNPLKSDRDLCRLVVLNNCADCVCIGEIRYADLMPDCTVEEFLNALWVRFGLVYVIDYDTNSVRMQLLSDILQQRGAMPLDSMMTRPEKVVYGNPQYIKLQAQTSIEGAAPVTERFEDFVRGLDLKDVHMGMDVSQWQKPHDRWEGDVWEPAPDPDEPEEPDPIDPIEPDEPDYPDPDDPDYPDYSDAQAIDMRAASSSASASKNNTFLAREFVTGNWYKLDDENRQVRASSSPFFCWDPKPSGIDPLELSSVDECVPLERVRTIGMGTDNGINAICPLFLTGARHYHSYIKGSDDDEDSGGSTPLAFMFAYTKDGATFGRISPEGEDGLPLAIDDGQSTFTPTVSLLFQFKDGLFARYWSRYDEILRHGNRTVEVSLRVNQLMLRELSMLSVYTLRGVRCLIDSMSYSLPAGKMVAVDMKLRPIMTQGRYDIAAEQRVPDFSVSRRHLEWQLVSETYGKELATIESRNQAASKFYQENYADSFFKPHIDYRGAIYRQIRRGAKTYANDPRNKNITAKATKTLEYTAYILYDIYEVFAPQTSQDEESIYVLSGKPLGQMEVPVKYTQTIRAVWVMD